MTLNDLFYPFGVEIKRISTKYKYMKLFSKHSTKKRYIPCIVNIDGENFLVPDSPSFAWQIREIFAENSYLFETTNSNPIILDIGANIGISVLWFKKHYPFSTIYAFEADAHIYEILEKNIGNFSDVHLFNKAVWNSNEMLSFHSDGADGGSVLPAKADEKKVQGIRLKEFISDFKKIDFLKIDIEGAETVVLQDCYDALQNIDNIFIEYHSFNQEKQLLGNILEILTNNGFRYYIKNVGYKRPLPFVDKQVGDMMDMQIEIIGYRI
ncbi:MAG: FkbM family methyltransferase [Massilibacteroides sp.]|nr:FkbM family methyltransferase [Massilibacteroides sp.]MDD3062271.1 FkbM family methyltransferase [Massilibacteroides sp.]MDD4113990.1 FkbM family methyltransferase [Massilibacteroides sp.]MDD4660044.1 FkbM family methyltransferase [Massilibacteroides sp.]